MFLCSCTIIILIFRYKYMIIFDFKMLYLVPAHEGREERMLFGLLFTVSSVKFFYTS